MLHLMCQILTDARTDDAYTRAEAGEGDADGYQVVETGVDGIKTKGKRQ